MKKLFILILGAVMFCSTKADAQLIDLKDFDLNNLLGKVLQVKKGWAPQFFSGKKKIPKINIVSQLLNTKNNTEISRLFNTFKTGRTVYRITTYAGSAFALYGTIKNIINNKDSVSSSVKNQARTMLYSGLGSMTGGTLVKLLTKAASYKAVDLFGGLIKKKLVDILSFEATPSTNYLGKNSFKAALIIRL